MQVLKSVSLLLSLLFTLHAKAQNCEESMNTILGAGLSKETTYIDDRVSMYGLDCKLLPQYRDRLNQFNLNRSFSNLANCNRVKGSNAPATINMELTYSNPDNYTNRQNKKISTSVNDKNEWIVKVETGGAAGFDTTEYIWKYEDAGNGITCQLKEIRSESQFANRSGSGSQPSSGKAVTTAQSCQQQLAYNKSLPSDAAFEARYLESKEYNQLMDQYIDTALKDATREDKQRYEKALKSRNEIKERLRQDYLKEHSNASEKKLAKLSSYSLTQSERRLVEAKSTAVTNWHLLQKIRRQSCEFYGPFFGVEAANESVAQTLKKTKKSPKPAGLPPSAPVGSGEAGTAR